MANKRNLRITDDRVFRFMYGEGTESSNKALISMLNTVLDRKENPIVSVTVMNPVSVSALQYSHEVIMDIKAKTSNEELIDIEMQKYGQDSYMERAIFSGVKLCSGALEKGMDYGSIKKSIVITFSTGKLFPYTKDYLNKFVIRNEKYDELMTDKMEFIFMELGKLPDKPIEEMTELEALGVYIRDEGAPEKAGLVEKLIESGKEAVILSNERFLEVTDEEREWAYQHSREMYEHDMATLKVAMRKEMRNEVIAEVRNELKKELSEELRKEVREEAIAEGQEKGREEGLAEGQEKGIAEGEKRTILKTAKTMKEKGYEIAEIFDITGLSKEEIEKL